MIAASSSRFLGYGLLRLASVSLTVVEDRPVIFTRPACMEPAKQGSKGVVFRWCYGGDNRKLTDADARAAIMPEEETESLGGVRSQQ
jgi:hypothetical protein